MKEDDIQNSKEKPDDWFLSDKEANQHYNQILYNYDLISSYIFILYVEGSAEKNIFKDWLRYQYNGHLIEIIIMGGADDINAITRCTVNKIKDREYFFLFDYDSEKDYKDRTDKLKQANINEDNYYFFKPDFVTENFPSSDILLAYKNWLKSEEIEQSEDGLKQLEYSLLNKKAHEKYEDILIQFNNKQEIFPNFSKPQFAYYLSKIVIGEVMKGRSSNSEISKSRRVFPFEDVFYGKNGFFKQIKEYIDLNYIKYFKESN